MAVLPVQIIMLPTRRCVFSRDCCFSKYRRHQRILRAKMNKLVGKLVSKLVNKLVNKLITKLAARMMLRMQLLKSLPRHMRIDLRGRDIRMPKQQLYYPQVGAVIKQMGGKGMP